MIRAISAAAFCCVLGGCATRPVETNDGISIGRVTERVKCELGQALAAYPELGSWAAVIILTLAADETGTIKPGTGITGPFGAGTYGVDFAAGFSAETLRTSLVTYYLPVSEAMAAANSCPRPGSPMEDTLGLSQWIHRVFDAGNAEGLSFKGEKSIGYTLQFTIDVSAGVTPAFKLSRASGQTGLTFEHKAINTLDLAMVEAHLPNPALAPAAARPPRKRAAPEHSSELESPFVPDPSSSAKPEAGRPDARAPLRQTTRGSQSVGPTTKRELDAIIQQLIFKQLRRNF